VHLAGAAPGAPLVVAAGGFSFCGRLAGRGERCNLERHYVARSATAWWFDDGRYKLRVRKSARSSLLFRCRCRRGNPERRHRRLLRPIPCRRGRPTPRTADLGGASAIALPIQHHESCRRSRRGVAERTGSEAEQVSKHAGLRLVMSDRFCDRDMNGMRLMHLLRCVGPPRAGHFGLRECQWDRRTQRVGLRNAGAKANDELGCQFEAIAMVRNTMQASRWTSIGRWGPPHRQVRCKRRPRPGSAATLQQDRTTPCPPRNPPAGP
jgi:hypothetical protein